MATRYYEIKSWGLKTNFETKKYSRSQHQPISDRIFLKRVHEYLRINRHSSFIDADSLVCYLRNKYPEYRRRPFHAVKGLAGRVIAKLSEGVDMDSEVDPDSRGRYAEPQPSFREVGPDTEPDADMTVDEDEEGDLPDEQWDELDPHDRRIGSTVSYDRFGRRINPRSGQISGGSLPPSSTYDDYHQPLRNKKKKTRPLSSVPSPHSRRRGYPDYLQEYDELEPSNELIPEVTFTNVAGYTKILNEILQSVIHLNHPEIFVRLGIEPPRGFLLHGPPGCGKTLIAQAVAGELRIPLIDVAAPELVSGISGHSEKLIRKVFDSALKLAPCVLFIDEVDVISTNRSNVHKDMERRIVSQLLLSIDGLNKDEKGGQVLLIGATSQPDALDPSLRRAGRFDKEVCIGIPDQDSRCEILRMLSSDVRLADDVSIDELATRSPGFVAADLLALLKESIVLAVHRLVEELSADDRRVSEVIDLRQDEEDDKSALETEIGINNEITATKKSSYKPRNKSLAIEKKKFIQMRSWISSKTPIHPALLESLCITKEDFDIALKRVQPSSKREGFATVPDVTWDDVGSLKDIRRELQMMLVEPVKYQNLFNQIGIPAGAGVLLCGPPGCGKTLLAKAIANETGINFISVKGPELLNMYVGGSERAVRDCFHRAKNSQPCVIFFDELDALCPKRSDSENGGTTSRVVNQLLTEMDGVISRQGVYLMAATNRPDIIDPAIMRPGRFDKILYVGFPNADDRVDILKAITKKGTHLFGEDVDLEAIGKACKGYTGADLAALLKETMNSALYERNINKEPVSEDGPLLYAKHFNDTMRKIKPSVGVAERKYYEHIRQIYTTSIVSSQEESEYDDGDPDGEGEILSTAEFDQSEDQAMYYYENSGIGRLIGDVIPNV